MIDTCTDWVERMHVDTIKNRTVGKRPNEAAGLECAPQRTASYPAGGHIQCGDQIGLLNDVAAVPERVSLTTDLILLRTVGAFCSKVKSTTASAMPLIPIVNIGGSV